MSAAPANLGIQNIGQICINVQDLQRATAFYRDVLGLPLLFTVPNLAFFDCGGVRLMLGPAETPEFDHPSSILLLPRSGSECRLPAARRGRCPNFCATATDCADAHVRSLDGSVQRLRGKHSPTDERSPTREIAFCLHEAYQQPHATRVRRITVSSSDHA